MPAVLAMHCSICFSRSYKPDNLSLQWAHC